MKKLMFAAAVMAAGVAMADIVSSSVVGYSQPKTEQQSVCWTPMFIPVSGFETTYSLSDFTASGMVDYADSIQFLDPDTAETYLMAVYLDEADYPGMGGWWNFEGAYDPLADKIDDQSFAYGTSFLAAFTGGGEITLKYAGVVLDKEKTFTFDQQSVCFGNYLPVDLKLKDITATGMVDYADAIQFLDPDTAEMSTMAVYLDEADYPGMGGWWNFEGSFDPENDKLDEMTVPAGQGFLAAFTGGGEITVTFPAAY